MDATSEYLNRRLRSLDEVCRDLERRRIEAQDTLDLIFIEQRLHSANAFRRAS